MTNLRSALSKRIEEAWNTAQPDPEPSDVLTESWYGISNSARLNLIDFADRLIGQLIEDGKLAESSRPLHLWHAEVTKMLNEIGGLGDLSQGDAVKRVRQLQLLEEYEVTEDQLHALIDVIAAGKFVPSIHLMQFIDAGISAPSEWMELNRVTTDGHEAHALVKQATELAKMGVTSEDFQAFMRQHLAEPPQDDWQECEFDEIRKGDRVKAVSPDGVFQFRSPIKELSPVEDWLEIQHKSGMKTSLRISNSDFYRIPAVVQHPDPEEHPVIMGVVTRDGSNHDFGVRNWSTYHVYSDGQSEGFMNSDQITDWSPAKVVPAGDYRD